MQSHNPSITMKIALFSIVALLIAGMAFQACERIYERFGITPDNQYEDFVEELLEDYIEEETGQEIEIDLTPNSP